MEFNPELDHSQICGCGRRKWIQNGRYFDKNFELVRDDELEQEMPAVQLKSLKPIATPVVSRVVGKVDDAA